MRVVRQLKQPEKKKAVVEEIKKEVKPSIREKLALNVAKIQREEANLLLGDIESWKCQR